MVAPVTETPASGEGSSPGRGQMKRAFNLRVAVIAATLIVSALVFGLWVSGGTGNSVSPNVARKHAADAVEQTLKMSVSQMVDGREWAVGRFDNTFGETCVDLRSPSGWRAVNCPPASTEARGIVAINVGGVDTKYVYGLAGDGVARIELVTADCARFPVQLNNQVFLYILPKGSSEGDALVARDAFGTVIDERLLRESGFPTGKGRC